MVSIDILNSGTKEALVVDLTDRLGTITDLSTYVVDYKVVSEDEVAVKIDWTPVNSINGMEVLALIDTTVGTWAEGTYKLYIKPTIGFEQPILGPMEFGLS